MKKLAMVILLLVVPAAARTQRPAVYGSDRYANDQISQSLTWLPYHLLDNWTIFVIPSDDWWAGLTPALRKRAAGSCYSRLDTHITYCRLEWARGADSREIAHTLTHELGHLVCNCRDESRAETFADRPIH
jgi:hypothetical protein